MAALAKSAAEHSPEHLPSVLNQWEGEPGRNQKVSWRNEFGDGQPTEVRLEVYQCSMADERMIACVQEGRYGRVVRVESGEAASVVMAEAAELVNAASILQEGEQ